MFWIQMKPLTEAMTATGKTTELSNLPYNDSTTIGFYMKHRLLALQLPFLNQLGSGTLLLQQITYHWAYKRLKFFLFIDHKSREAVRDSAHYLHSFLEIMSLKVDCDIGF